jgi:arylsulfatase A-like enzyme
VPFLLRYPGLLGEEQVRVDMPISTPDIMPTLLGLSGLEIPESVEGLDYSGYLRGDEELDVKAALIMCPVPFHQWSYILGGREYRGVRTQKYTYARDLEGPWILYDNLLDPYQQNNLVDSEGYKEILMELDEELDRLLVRTGDKFLSGPVLMETWEYDWDNNDDSIPPIHTRSGR